jgi:hypothetical protein
LGGVIALIAALGGLVVLLSAFDLTDKRAALGMPEGSIRAVIALMLILLFSIMGIYIFATIRFSDANVLTLRILTSRPPRRLEQVTISQDSY